MAAGDAESAALRHLGSPLLISQLSKRFTNVHSGCESRGELYQAATGAAPHGKTRYEPGEILGSTAARSASIVTGNKGRTDRRRNETAVASLRSEQHGGGIALHRIAHLPALLCQSARHYPSRGQRYIPGIGGPG